MLTPTRSTSYGVKAFDQVFLPTVRVPLNLNHVFSGRFRGGDWVTWNDIFYTVLVGTLLKCCMSDSRITNHLQNWALAKIKCKIGTTCTTSNGANTGRKKFGYGFLSSWTTIFPKERLAWMIRLVHKTVYAHSDCLALVCNCNGFRIRCFQNIAIYAMHINVNFIQTCWRNDWLRKC